MKYDQGAVALLRQALPHLLTVHADVQLTKVLLYCKKKRGHGLIKAGTSLRFLTNRGGATFMDDVLRHRM